MKNSAAKKLTTKDIKGLDKVDINDIGIVRLRDGTSLSGFDLKKYFAENVKSGLRTLSSLEQKFIDDGIDGAQRPKRKQMLRLLKNIHRTVPQWMRDLDISFEHERKDVETGITIESFKRRSGKGTTVKRLKIDTAKGEKKQFDIDPISGGASGQARGLQAAQPSAYGGQKSEETAVDPITGKAIKPISVGEVKEIGKVDARGISSKSSISTSGPNSAGAGAQNKNFRLAV